MNFKLRKKLCETLVLSVLNYSLILCFPFLLKTTKYRLQLIQNYCCRFIYGLRKYDRVSAKINELGWLKIENLYKYYLGSLVYRILSTSIPPYLKCRLVHRGSLHDRSIRHTNTLDMPRFRFATSSRGFTYNAVTVYNSIPASFKTRSEGFFKRSFKSLLLESQKELFFHSNFR